MNALTLIRAVFLVFATALALIGVVVGILTASHSGTGRFSALPVVLVVVVVGAAGLAGGRVLDPPLDCADGLRLATSYRDRFFVRLGFSESGAFAGFVGFVLSGRWWFYPLGAAVAAVGYSRLAPTAANLTRDQEALRSTGCSLSLLDALAGPPARADQSQVVV